MPLPASVHADLYEFEMSQELEEKFKKAVWLIRNGPKQDSSNETKLNFYKYFKQATEGDVKGSQPYRVQIEARAKWDAWNSVKGLSKEEAMKKYIELMDNSDWEKNETLREYPGPQWMTI